MRGFVGRHIFDLEHHLFGLHKFAPTARLWTTLALAADVTVGWGPWAEDWETNNGYQRFLRWFYRWYWQGKCQSCNGRGTLIWVEIRQPDGSYTRVENPLCRDCNGTGIGPSC